RASRLERQVLVEPRRPAGRGGRGEPDLAVKDGSALADGVEAALDALDRHARGVPRETVDGWPASECNRKRAIAGGRASRTSCRRGVAALAWPAMGSARCARRGGPTSRWWILTAVECGNFVVYMDGFIVTLSLPAMAREFGVGIHEMKWVLIAYLAALTMSLLVAGRLADRWGRKPVTVVGVVLLMVG